MSYVEINLKNIKENCQKIKKLFPQYKYYMGVVKSDAYGCGIKAIKSISKEMNYLVVANIDEAIKIRKYKINKPILVLQPIEAKDIKIYEKYNITATIDNIDVIKKINDHKINVHIKIDTGMNRFGFKEKQEFIESYNLLKKGNLKLEGIYTHLYFVDNKEITNNQIIKFKSFINLIDYNKVPIIHIAQSLGVTKYKNIEFANGIRIGDLMYGITEEKKFDLKSTFSFVSKIVSIKKVSANETVGYDANFKCKKDEVIGIIPIGYSHGLTKNHINTNVIINNKEYPIISNTMNISFIKIDNTIKINDKVYIYNDINHIMKLSNQLNTVPQELMTIIDKNINKKYIEK